MAVDSGEGDYDVLVHHCNSVFPKNGDFHVAGVESSLGKMPCNTLLLSGENSAKVHRLMPGVWARLLWLVFAGARHPALSTCFYTLMRWIFSIRCRIKSIEESEVCHKWNEFTYYRATFSDYVKNLPGTNNYAILTNKTESAREENILSLPLFLSLIPPTDTQNFISVKERRLYEKKSKFCAFIVSSGHYPSILNYARVWFCMALRKYKKVDCYGAILNNAAIPAKLLERHCDNEVDLSHFTSQDTAQACRDKYHPDCGRVNVYALNQALFRDYKFVICFENSMAEDYITEKLPNAMLGNSIGIYHGAPNVGEYFNTKSFIHCADYPNYEAVIQRIIELDQDDEQYRQMLREPFFVDNQIPETILNKEKELKQFLDKILLDNNAQERL